MNVKTIGPSLGFDTSENLTLAQYQFLKSQGFSWGCRYVPLAGQSPTSPGVISAYELAAAFSVGMGMMFVQFAQETTWTAQQGLLDGQAAGAYVLSLGVPNTVCLWCDLGVTSSAQVAADYTNAWYQGTVNAGMNATAAGVYMEPGVPLTSEQRYQMINVHRYWATAANDPNRFPSSRGCQLIQLWNSSKGEYSPELGIEIDADVSQEDYFESAPVAVFGS
jgi:Domain of unknown function (DUF1906)